ncbi:hypothetical protein, partial [Kribbia dieselivorans]|uniref:hypothetical protein n=1 Tax=Kribbia dieselivorans TaxID=331526 RepID=UPI0012EDEF04
MSVLIRRIVGAVVAILGIVVLATVLPVLSHIGSGGRATFTAAVDTDGIVSLDPQVLNRVDAPVEITAR